MENNLPTQNTNVPPASPQPTSPAGKKSKINKTLVLVIGLVILTIVLLVLSLTARNSGSLPIIGNKDSDNNETIAFTTLSISEDVRIADAGGYEADVLIDSGENKITGIQLELTYDPEVLTNVDIKPGTFFSSPTVLQKEINQETGTIKYLLGTTAGSEPISGEGSIAVITFNKSGDEETNIDFSANTLVTDNRYAESVLSETTSGIIGTLPASTTPSSNSAVPIGTQSNQ